MSKRYYLELLAAPVPCTHCENNQRCKTDSLACEAFRCYVNEDCLGAPTEPTEPNETIYRNLYGNS
jgi:hypothetical protein